MDVNIKNEKLQNSKITIQILKENIGILASLFFRALVLMISLIMCIIVFLPENRFRDLEETERYATTINYLDFYSETTRVRRSTGITIHWATFDTTEGRCFCQLSFDAQKREQEKLFLEELEKSGQEVMVSKIERYARNFGESLQIVDIRDDSQIYLSVDVFNNYLLATNTVCFALGITVFAIVLYKSKPLLNRFQSTYRKRKKQLKKQMSRK